MRLLALIGFLAIAGIIAAGVYFLGGYYDVGVTAKEPEFIASFLQRARDASIAKRAHLRPPVPLEDKSVIEAGAKSFSTRGCVTCHGAPGVIWAKFAEGMDPDPPDLKDVAKDLTAAEIFWVVKNGIRMTGMPAFSLIGADDKEIWNIAAFVKRLPTVTPEDYKAWTANH